MLCQRCKQTNATVHLTDIQQGGEPQERHLCENCAEEEGVAMKAHEPVSLMLEKFVKLGSGLQEAAQRTCSHCGISFGEFRAQGQLGCAHDYTEFGDLLMPLIQRAHDGADHHTGKRPGEAAPARPVVSRMTQLRRQLDEAVAREAYEEAAQIRDELRCLDGADDAGGDAEDPAAGDAAGGGDEH